MNNLKEKRLIVILGGKFSSKIVFQTLKYNKYFNFVIYDNTLNKKFYEGNYTFIKKVNILEEKISQNKNNIKFVLATSSITARKKWIKKFSIKLKDVINVISKDYVINYAKKIGNGNLIWSRVTLDHDSKIGNFNFINNSSLILHDAVIGSHNFIGPNTTILGNANIGNNCYIGSNSIIDSNIIIGNNCIIGANSFINKNVKSGSKVFGTPGLKQTLKN